MRLARLGVNGVEGADDHELHVVGVMLAGRRDAGLHRVLASQQRVELADGFVAGGEAVTQLLLLPMQLLIQRAVLLLQLPQPADVRPIGGADEMRQHVHVLERLLHDRLGGDRMTQERPICTRDVAAPHRLVPQPAQRILVLGFAILLDRQRVPAVERESLEDHIAGLLQPVTDDGETALELSARTMLYVGGRPNQIPQLKSLVERTGARFLHHDGGIEHSSSLLPGLISRADVLLFPIDCISHDAVATLKRLCRQLEKPYLPLRTASLATLASSLAGMARNRDT